MKRLVLASVATLASIGASASSVAKSCEEQWKLLEVGIRRGPFTELVLIGHDAANDFRTVRGPKYSEAGDVRYYDLARPFTGAHDSYVVVDRSTSSTLVLIRLYVGASKTEAQRVHKQATDAFRALCPADIGAIEEEVDETGLQAITVARLSAAAMARLSIFARLPLAVGPKETQYEVIWTVQRGSIR